MVLSRSRRVPGAWVLGIVCLLALVALLTPLRDLLPPMPGMALAALGIVLLVVMSLVRWMSDWTYWARCATCGYTWRSDERADMHARYRALGRGTGPMARLGMAVERMPQNEYGPTIDGMGRHSRGWYRMMGVAALVLVLAAVVGVVVLAVLP